MGNMLIRGIPPRVHREIQRLAEEENLSVNLFLVQRLIEMVKKNGAEKAEEERRKEVFHRIEEMREKMRRKYGKQEDSTKIIRELRDSR